MVGEPQRLWSIGCTVAVQFINFGAASIGIGSTILALETSIPAAALANTLSRTGCAEIRVYIFPFCAQGLELPHGRVSHPLTYPRPLRRAKDLPVIGYFTEVIRVLRPDRTFEHRAHSVQQGVTVAPVLQFQRRIDNSEPLHRDSLADAVLLRGSREPRFRPLNRPAVTVGSDFCIVNELGTLLFPCHELLIGRTTWACTFDETVRRLTDRLKLLELLHVVSKLV